MDITNCQLTAMKIVGYVYTCYNKGKKIVLIQSLDTIATIRDLTGMCIHPVAHIHAFPLPRQMASCWYRWAIVLEAGRPSLWPWRQLNSLNAFYCLTAPASKRLHYQRNERDPSLVTNVTMRSPLSFGT